MELGSITRVLFCSSDPVLFRNCYPHSWSPYSVNKVSKSYHPFLFLIVLSSCLWIPFKTFFSLFKHIILKIQTYSMHHAVLFIIFLSSLIIYHREDFNFFNKDEYDFPESRIYHSSKEDMFAILHITIFSFKLHTEYTVLLERFLTVFNYNIYSSNCSTRKLYKVMCMLIINM